MIEATRVAALLAVTCASAFARAQVNVEPLRDQVGDDQLGGRVQATFTGRVGNTQGLILGATGLIGGRSGRHFGFVAASGDHSRFGGETQVGRYFAHARYNLQVTDVLIGEAFAQAEHDRFQRLSLRRLLGAGPRFELVDDETLSVALGTAYMLELENLRETEQFPAEENTFHRSSSYAVGLIAPDERVSFEVACYFQPRFDDFADFRVLNIDTLEFAITPLLTAQISSTFRYDSVPPRGVKRFDLEVKNALGVKF